MNSSAVGKKFAYPEAVVTLDDGPLPVDETAEAPSIADDDAAAATAAGGEEVAARWVDVNTSDRPPPGSRELRDNWGGQASRVFGVFNRNPARPSAPAAPPLKPSPSTAVADINNRRTATAMHDLASTDWGRAGGGLEDYAKRARTRVLHRTEEPDRGAGIPIGGVTVHFPAGLTPHVPQKITMSKAGWKGFFFVKYHRSTTLLRALLFFF